MLIKKSLDEIVYIISKWKRTFFVSFIIIALLSITISLILPKWYKSTCKILISSKSRDILDVSSLIGDFPLDFGTPPSQEMMRISAIITSRTFLDGIIEKFNLQEVYGQEFLFKTRDLLKEYITIEPSFDEASLTISFVYESEPEKAAEICRYILEKINEIYSQLQTTEARNNRIYLQKVYEETLDKLGTLEDSLKIFQDLYGTYELDQQLTATIQAQAELESQLLQAQIEYNLLREVVGKEKSQLQDLLLKIKVLKQEIHKFQTEKSDASIFIPLKDVPDQALTYYKLKREIEIIGKVLEFLTPQYEQAKIQEIQSKPGFIILDYPDIPEYKYKPKRAYIVLGSVFFGMLLLVIYVMIKEYFEDLERKNPSKYNSIVKLLREFNIFKKA
jgi:capsule polysaccharide export protein KpsE/RkpR